MKLPCLLVILWLFAVTTASAQFTLFNTANSNLPSDSCARIGIDSINQPWIGHFDAGISVLVGGESFTNYTPANSPLAWKFITFVLHDGGKMWFADYGHQLLNFDGTTWGSINNLPGYHIYGLYRTGDHLWISTKYDGVFDYNLATYTYEPYNYFTGLPTDYFFRIMGDNSGNIFAGTAYEGVMKYNGSWWQQICSSNSPLPQDDVYSLAFDPAGNAWFGTYGGLAELQSDGVWITYDNNFTGIPDNYIRNVITYGDYVFVATGYGGVGVLHRPTNHWTVFNTANSNLPSNRAWDLVLDQNLKLWVATMDHGIARLDDIVMSIEHSPETGRLVVSPNPAREQVRVNIPDALPGEYTLSILSGNGRTMLEEKVRVNAASHIHLLDIGSLPCGLYLVKVSGQGLTFTEKLVIK